MSLNLEMKGLVSVYQCKEKGGFEMNVDLWPYSSHFAWKVFNDCEVVWSPLAIFFLQNHRVVYCL